MQKSVHDGPLLRGPFLIHDNPTNTCHTLTKGTSRDTFVRPQPAATNALQQHENNLSKLSNLTGVPEAVVNHHMSREVRDVTATMEAVSGEVLFEKTDETGTFGAMTVTVRVLHGTKSFVLTRHGDHWCASTSFMTGPGSIGLSETFRVFTDTSLIVDVGSHAGQTDFKLDTLEQLNAYIMASMFAFIAAGVAVNKEELTTGAP